MPKFTLNVEEKSFPNIEILKTDNRVPWSGHMAGYAIKEIYKKIPILGVCLGHQVIGQVFGGKIVQAKNLMHGKTSKIIHTKKGLFKNVQKNFEATRYHSLIVERKNFPEDLIITAETKNKTIMGLMHKRYNIHGFQFHPESISTKVGLKLIKNFITN